MKNIKEVLQKLEQNNMHVHEIDREIALPVYATVIDTHFIMHGAEIVHVGNLVTIESYVLQLNIHRPSLS